eukprot:COSAG03_NODE_499_length_7409_cov_11.656088_12_plen_709_part_00
MSNPEGHISHQQSAPDRLATGTRSIYTTPSASATLVVHGTSHLFMSTVLVSVVSTGRPPVHATRTKLFCCVAWEPRRATATAALNVAGAAAGPENNVCSLPCGMALPQWGFFEGDPARQFTVAADDHSTILGAGAYGAVYSATMNGLPVAAKTLHALRDPVMYGLAGPGADPGAAEAVRIQFDEEAKALAELCHPNVLGFLGVCYAREQGALPILPKWIVTERQPNSLDRFIRLPGMLTAMSLADVTFLSTDVAEGMAHLHTLGMVHRDLKPKNVLVGPGGAKVADLGTAKLIGIAARTAQHTVGPGTAIYHPPEVLQGEYSAAIDVYSFGLLVLEVILVEAPRRQGAHDPIDEDQQRRALQAHPSLQGVMSGCLAIQSQQRPPSERVVKLLQEVMNQPSFFEEPATDDSGTWADRTHRRAMRQELDHVTWARRCQEMLKRATMIDVFREHEREQRAAVHGAELVEVGRLREAAEEQLAAVREQLEQAQQEAAREISRREAQIVALRQQATVSEAEQQKHCQEMLKEKRLRAEAEDLKEQLEDEIEDLNEQIGRLAVEFPEAERLREEVEGQLAMVRDQLEQAQQEAARERHQRVQLATLAAVEGYAAVEAEERKAQRMRVLLEAQVAEREEQVAEGQREIAALRQTIANQRPDARMGPQPDQEEVCKYFLKGRCRFGDTCRHKHDAPPECSVCRGEHLGINCPNGGW